MALPILKVSHASEGDLLRMFHRARLHWARHEAEETTFDFGTAFTNPQLPRYGNQVVDALVPDGLSAAEVLAQAEEHFEKAGAVCRRWVMAPGAGEARTKPLVEALMGRGFVRGSYDILHLSHQPTTAIQEVGGLTIIPARASYKHVRQLAEEWAAVWKAPELAEAIMLHLDGDHTDALIALKDGKPAAFAFVLGVGDFGCIEDLFVSAAFRNQGVGRTMMSRAMEICARSLFKHVFIGADAENGPAMKLYYRFGFQRVGEYVSYARQ